MGKRARSVTRRTGAVQKSVANHPWAWIFLALNPLFIINQIHTIDFYIKAVYIAAVLVLTFLFTRNAEYKPDGALKFNWMELFFMGYVGMGTLALLWSEQPILGFERLVYLLYAVGGYVVGKQTRFWESTLFWNVFIGVAALVGIVGIGMYYFFGSGHIFGFDWIMSAGRPSSTLSYRAYAGTYLVMTLPFMVWFMFSNHIRSNRHFIYAALCFSLTMLFMLCARARSAWIGLGIAGFVMVMMYAYRAVRTSPDDDLTWRRKFFFVYSPIGALLGAAVMGYFGFANESIWFPGLETGWFLGTLFSIIGYGLGLMAMWALMLVIISTQHRETSRGLNIGLARALPFILLLGGIYGLSRIEPSEGLIAGDKNPQKLKGTGKETVEGTVSKTLTLLLEGRSDRLQFWNISRRMLIDKSNRGKYEDPAGTGFWLMGTGIGQWPVYVPIYSSILHSLGAEVHNDWVQALVETGIFGFICWCGIFVTMLYYSARRYKNMLMIAVVGGLFAWLFSTQTDFLTARIYGLLWLGGMAAMIDGIANPRKIVSLQWMSQLNWARIGTVVFVLGGIYVYAMYGFGSNVGIMLTIAYLACGAFCLMPMGNLEPSRRLAACFFLFLAVGYSVTAWCDRQIYRALVDSNPPVDQLVDIIFDDDHYPSYRYGIGKYLIFSPITDLSRAVSKNLAEQNVQPLQRQTFDNVQERLATEVLWMHPYNHNAVALLADITTRRKEYDKALELNDRYLDIRPEDAQMYLFKSQTLLERGDSLEAGKAIHKARTVAPNHQLAMQFWQARLNESTRRKVIEELGEFEFNLARDDEDEVLTPDEGDEGDSVEQTAPAGASDGGSRQDNAAPADTLDDRNPI